MLEVPNLSYILLVVKPKRQSYILDDKDVFVYLTSVHHDQRRSILHIEGMTELEKVPISEQLSRTKKTSSYDGNHCEISSGLPKGETNDGAVILYTANEEAEQHLKVI
ncbi:hypothetical protein N665_0091s0006 [Sinapis alba]|nr:hypothetical protein N665_0091s0006 [Sinapis alba]